MEWQSQQEYLRGGGGRGGGHPTSYIRPEGFVYCLSKDRFLQCQNGILLLNLKYVRLTELKSFLSIFRDQCKKKKNASTPVVIFLRAQLGMQTCELNA